MALAGLGIGVYMIAAVATDAARLGNAVRELGAFGIAVVLALSLVNYLLRFQRWQLYIGRLGHRLPVTMHLLSYLGGFAFTVSPAKAGEAVRSFYLRMHGVGYADSIAALFVERLLDLIAMILLAGLVVLHHKDYWPVLVGTSVVALAMLAIVGQVGLPRWLNSLAVARGARVARALKAAADLLHSSQQLLRPRLLFSGLVLGVVAWGAEGVGFLLICRGLNWNIDAVAAVGIYATSALAGGAAFFMPGGIGGMELVMTTLLLASGAPLQIALIATLLCRLATLWFAVLLGLLAALILESRLKNRQARPAS
jgi:uncharacterized membrane protein YbhN (UPF0104 family)